MWTVFWRSLKDRRVLLLIYTLSSVILLWMYVAFFPAFKDQSAAMEKMLEAYPESLMKAFNFDIKSFTTVEGFLSTEQFSMMWPLLLILMLVGFAGASIAGEIEKGTIELLISQPISRAKLFLSRYLAGVLMLLIFVVFSIFAAIPLAEAYNINFKADNFVTMAVLGFIFGLSIFSLGMFFSSIFSDKGKVFFATGGLLVVMYVLNIVSSIKESLVDLKYFSVFYYFNPSKALVYHQIDNWAYLVFISSAFILTILGLIIFTRRDITT